MLRSKDANKSSSSSSDKVAVDAASTLPGWMNIDKQIERCFPVAFTRSLTSSETCESFCVDHGADGAKFTARMRATGTPLRVAAHDCHCYDMTKCKELKGSSRNFHNNHYSTVTGAKTRDSDSDDSRMLRSKDANKSSSSDKVAVDAASTLPGWMNIDKQIERCFPVAFTRSLTSSETCESFCVDHGADGAKFTARMRATGTPLRVAAHDCHCYDMTKCKELKGSSRNFHDN